MSTTINEKLETIIEMIDRMNKKLDRLERSVGTQTNPFVYPGDNTPQPDMDFHASTTCSKCGLVFEGTTSYYCPQNDCPTFMKVT